MKDDLAVRLRRRAMGLPVEPIKSVPPADRTLPPPSGTTLNRPRRNTWWRRLLGLEIDRDE